MSKIKATKTKKATEVKQSQKISSFFRKVETKPTFDVIDDPDFKCSKIFTKSNYLSAGTSSENSGSGNGSENKNKSSDSEKIKPKNETKKKNVVTKQIKTIDLDNSDEDFVTSHLEKYKSKPNNLFKNKDCVEVITSDNKVEKVRKNSSKDIKKVKVLKNEEESSKKSKIDIKTKNINKLETKNSDSEGFKTAEDVLDSSDDSENLKNKKTCSVDSKFFENNPKKLPSNIREASTTSKYYSISNLQPSKKDIDLSADNSNLIINLDSEIIKNKTINQIIDTTPEKSYLKRDEVLNDVTNTGKKPLDLVFANVDLLKSSRKESPPHSTPILNTKRKSFDVDNSDIIPGTPEDNLEPRVKNVYKKLLNKILSPKLIEEEHVVPEMIIRSPPKKIRKIIIEPKQVVNLSDLTENEFQKIHAEQFKHPVKEEIKIEDSFIDTTPHKQQSASKPIKIHLTPPKLSKEPTGLISKRIQTLLSPLKVKSPSKAPIETFASTSKPIQTLLSPLKQKTPSKRPVKTVSSPSKLIRFLRSPPKLKPTNEEVVNFVQSENGPIRTQGDKVGDEKVLKECSNQNVVGHTQKTPTKSPIRVVRSPNYALSTSKFVVTPSRNMSPSKWSPMQGSRLKSPLTPSRSDIRSPCKRSLDFSKNQPKISAFMSSPAKSNDTLLDYFKNLPLSSEEKKQTEIDRSNFVCTRKSPRKIDTFEDLNFDDSWDLNVDSNLDLTTNNLNLDKWQYCKIIDVSTDLYQNLILRIECIKNHEKTSCIVQGIWRNIKLKKGDKINIIATKNNGNIPYCVNNDFGFVVYEPDFLISGTSIVGSLFCKRRGVLSDKFRGTDPQNQVMIVGSLVHRLLQEVLLKKVSKRHEIEHILIEILKGKDILHTSYSSQIPIDIIKQHSLPFIPRIVEFVDKYVNAQTSKIIDKKDNWKGTIESIQDIEENIWCSELGIKGKVDVTVKTNRRNLKSFKPTPFNAFILSKNNPSINESTSILPLELKTGRASYSLEHRGQVILYTMMMTELGYDVSSGLLLYLREGVLGEVESKHKEKRDLIMLRNELAYYLKQQPVLPKIDKDFPDNRSDSSKMSSKMSEEHPLRQLNFGELPEPINHHSACSKCPYSTICTVFLSKDSSYELSATHPLAAITKEVMDYLKQTHIDYIIHWSSLIHLESSYKPPMKEIKDIWRLPPIQREMLGKSLTYLQLSGEILEKTEPFIHHFIRCSDLKTLNLFTEEKCKTDLSSSGLVVGSYAVVSTDTRVAIAAGFISKITKSEIAIGLERNLSERYSNKTFHIDTYESQTIFNYSITGVATLLDNTDKAKRLRELIIDREPPNFASKLTRSVALTGVTILKRLNKIQQRAVLKALTAQDYMLIKGMPGTGKTATIVALIQLLVELKKTVLITSHTNSAVDNVCLRLLDCGVDFMRLGSETRVHPLLKHCLESTKTCHCKTVEDLEKVYNNAQVIAVTCLGASHPLLSRRTLDVCIVDESTQVLQCSVFRALQATKTFILIGDPNQLPPIVSNPEAVLRGMNESLFERLDAPLSTITLTLQYRMNKTITALANSVTYEGQLLCADDSIGYAILRLPKKERLQTIYNQEQWILNVLDDKIGSSVIGIDTGPTWNKLTDAGRTDLLEDLKVPVQNAQEDEERVFDNIYETAIISTIVDALKEAGIQSDSIGIIAPFRAQVALLRKILAKSNESEQISDMVEVNTVDQYQGRDKDVIIYSCTKSRDCSKVRLKSNFEILEDKRRLTVAITRAKHKLIIIGDFCTLKNYTPFETLLNTFEPHQVISVAYETMGFNWNKVMERIKQYNT